MSLPPLPPQDPQGLNLYASQLLDRAGKAYGLKDADYLDLIKKEIDSLNRTRRDEERDRRAVLKAGHQNLVENARKLAAEVDDLPKKFEHVRMVDLREQDRLDGEQKKGWFGLISSVGFAAASLILTATIWDSEKVALSVVTGLLGASGLGGAGFLGGKSVSSLSAARGVTPRE